MKERAERREWGKKEERDNITLRFPRALLNEVSREAVSQFRTRASIIFEAVAQYLDKRKGL